MEHVILFKPNKPLPPTPVDEDKKNKKKTKIYKLGKNKTSAIPNISAPVNVMHKLHITIDPVTGDFEVSYEAKKLNLLILICVIHL